MHGSVPPAMDSSSSFHTRRGLPLHRCGLPFAAPKAHPAAISPGPKPDPVRSVRSGWNRSHCRLDLCRKLGSCARRASGIRTLAFPASTKSSPVAAASYSCATSTEDIQKAHSSRAAPPVQAEPRSASTKCRRAISPSPSQTSRRDANQ